MKKKPRALFHVEVKKKKFQYPSKENFEGNLPFPGDRTLDRELTVGSLFGGDLKVWGFPGDSVVKTLSAK